MATLTVGDDAIDLDAVLLEEYARAGEVVVHPVQRGADLADHLRAGALELRLQVVVSNAPIRTPAFGFANGQYDRVAAIRERLERAQIDAEICTYDGRFGAVGDLLLSSLTVPFDGPRGGAIFGVVLRQVRVAEAELVEVAPREPSGAKRRDRGKQPAREVKEPERASFLFNLING